MIDFKRVLFVGCHTDDEMVTAGTLHRFVRRGAEVTILSLSSAGTETDRLNERTPHGGPVIDEWKESVTVIGAQGYVAYPLKFNPSYRLLTEQRELYQEIFLAVEKHKPEAAFVLSPQDPHPEHAAVGAACEAVMRGRVGWMFRCTFPWNFGAGAGNVYFRLDPEDVTAKRASCAAYKSQAFRYNYEEMLMAAARMDGLAIKAEYAEKFELIRGVV